MVLLTFLGYSQVDSGTICIPNSLEQIKQHSVIKMKVYISYSKEANEMEYLRLVYNFDSLGRIASKEDYYRGDLQYLVKYVYRGLSKEVVTEYLVPTSALEIVVEEFDSETIKYLMSGDFYSDVTSHKYSLNKWGLYDSVVLYVPKNQNELLETKYVPKEKLRFEYFLKSGN